MGILGVTLIPIGYGILAHRAIEGLTKARVHAQQQNPQQKSWPSTEQTIDAREWAKRQGLVDDVANVKSQSEHKNG